MKKLIYLIIVALILGLALTGCSVLSNVGQVPVTSQTKVKPDGLGGAQTYAWHLSADVMPVPPYGSMDIPGSDTASKLIVNQPNGNVEVVVTGVMNGLDPDTTYKVILSYGYTPYVVTEWNVSGSYVINVEYLGVDYPEYLVLVQSGTGITGVSLALVGGGSPWTINSGSVVGNEINFHLFYNSSPSLTANFSGIIAADGSMSGSWADVPPAGTRTGTWTTTDGHAINHTGDTTHPGDFNYYPRFTFLTDEYGAGSWHFNLRDEDFNGASTYYLSVWINQTNPNATILISDSFTVVVD